MNCRFCDQPCSLHPHDGRFPPGEIWACANHGAIIVKHYISVRYHKKGDCNGPDCCPKKSRYVDTMYWTYKGDEYQVNFFYHPDNYFRLDKHPGGGPGGFVIFDLPFHPELTPETLETRITLWLTFS
jgi:hypothetical protein